MTTRMTLPSLSDFSENIPRVPETGLKPKKLLPAKRLNSEYISKPAFYTTGGETCLVFDKEFLSLDDFENEVRKELTVNESYSGFDDDYYEAGEYELEASAGWRDADNFSEWNDLYDMDYILNEIESDPDFFNKYDFLNSIISYAADKVNCKLDGSQWLYEYDFTVNDNALTNTVNTSGEARVPHYYNSLERESEFPIDIMKGMEGAGLLDRENNKHMWLWVPEFYSNPDTISTTSTIVYDMGLVDENGDWYENTYTTVDGIIGKDADINAIEIPGHPDGLVFSHWSTVKPGEGVTQEKVSSIAYDYDAQTLYAVWREPSLDIKYTLKEFYMNADGTYPEDVEGVIENATPDSTVSAPESTDSLFVLDAEKSSKDVVINKDGSSVVNAYYERVKYNLVYHYEDNTGSAIDVYKVRFGDKLPAFDVHPSGVPYKTGYNFLGWTTVEGGTEPETLPTAMPTNDLHLYAIYEPIKVYYLFDAVEGTFANGDQYMRYEYAYGEKTEAPETPAAPGKEFVEWDNDIPANAYEDLTFEAIYEDEIYTVTFKADTDEDGTYETIVAEKEFVYGEKLYPEFAPENYPLDAWKLEDGTAVEISDEETAYTVTDSIVLYTVGKDEYPARFYWCEEDMESGAEPYTTVYVKYGEAVIAPEVPEKKGHTFIGWSADIPETMPAENLEFAAIYEPNTYNIDWCIDGLIMTDTCVYGETIETPNPFKKKGYTFIGWTPEIPETMPDYDLTFEAVWQVNTHTVTWNVDGVETNVEYDYIEAIILPEPPEKVGYTFIGWDAEVPSVMPDNDLYFTAEWEINKHNVIWICDENETVVEYYYGEEITVPEVPAKVGYTFIEWDAEIPATMPDCDLAFEAVWQINTHTVTWIVDGVETNVEYDYNEAIILPDPPEKIGYTFIGWDAEIPSVMPDNDLVFIAEWELNKYNVTWITDGEETTAEYFYGEEITVPELPEKTGYTLVGWTPEIPDTMPAENLILTAVYEVNYYDAVFFTNGGVFSDGTSVKRISTAYNASIVTPEKPYREGYDFYGWAYNGVNIGDSYLGRMDSIEGKIFEALWVSNEEVYYVVEYYMMNTVGEYECTSMIFTASPDQFISTLPPTAEGFIYNHEKSIDHGRASTDETLVLKFYLDREVYKFTTVIDSVSESVDYYYGAMISEPSVPVKDSYEFVGWDKEIPETMPANDVTVTAKFKVKAEDKTYPKLTISTPEKRTLYYGETITLYANVKNLPDGAKIKWSVEGDGVSIKTSASGKTCTVTSTSNGNVVIRATVVDKNGNTVKGSDGKPVSDYEYFYSEVNLWQIIVSFFRGLFRGR